MRIFILEDDAWYGAMLQLFLERNPDHEVKRFETADALFRNLHLKPDVVTLDFFLPDMPGDVVLKKIKTQFPDTALIVISGQQDVRTAISMLKAGVFDYLVKDEDTQERLWNAINHLRELKDLKTEVEHLKEEVGRKYDFNKIFVGTSDAIKKVYALIEKASKTNINVSITGETGTGKEVVARAVHYRSDRSKRPFVAVNVSAIPHDLLEGELFGYEKGAFTGAIARRIGKFEEAHTGTLFLDEIGELDINLQSKLLRVLQEREITRIGSNEVVPVDVRIIVATHKNLSDEVSARRFREDLYYRLLGLPIQLPPLRERGADMLILAKHFIQIFCKENKIPVKNLSPDAQKKLQRHYFPGNVRELKSLVELSVVLSDDIVIEPEHLDIRTPSGLDNLLSKEQSLKSYERQIIQHYLEKYNYDVPLVASKLGIGKSTIYRIAQNGDITLPK